MTKTVEEKNPVGTAAKEGKVWKRKLEANELVGLEKELSESFTAKSIQLDEEEFSLEIKKQIYEQFKEQQAPITLQGKSFKDYIANKYQNGAEQKSEDLEINIIENYLQPEIVSYIKKHFDAALARSFEQNRSGQADLERKIAKQEHSIKELSSQIETLDSKLTDLEEPLRKIKEPLIKIKTLLRSLKKYQECFIDTSLIKQLKSMQENPIGSKEQLANLQKIISLLEKPKKQQVDSKFSEAILKKTNLQLKSIEKKLEEDEKLLKEMPLLEESQKQLTDSETLEVLLERANSLLKLKEKEREEYEEIFIKKYQLDKEIFLDKEKVLNKIKELNAKQQELEKESANLKVLAEEIEGKKVEKIGEEVEAEFLLQEQQSLLNKLKSDEKNLQPNIINELYNEYWSQEHQADDENQRAVVFNEFSLQEALLHEYVGFIEKFSSSSLEGKASEIEAMRELAFFALYCHEGKYEQVAQLIIDQCNLDKFIERGFDKQTTYSVSLKGDGTVDYTTKVEFRNTTETGEDKFISITTTVNIKYEHIESDNGPTVSFTPKLKSCEIAADSGTAEELSQLEKDNDLQLTVYVEPRDVVFKLFKAVKASAEAVAQPAETTGPLKAAQVGKFSPGQIRELIVPEDKGKVVGMLAGCEQQDINSTQNHVKQNKTFSTAGSVRQPLVEIAGSQPANIDNKLIKQPLQPLHAADSNLRKASMQQAHKVATAKKSINMYVQRLLIKTAKVLFKELPEAKSIFGTMVSICEKLVKNFGLPIFKKRSNPKKIAEASSNAQGVNFSKMQKALGAKQPLKQGTQAAVPATTSTSTLKAEAKKQKTREAPLNSSGATNENPNNESTENQQTETNPKGKQKSPDYHWYVRRNLTL